MPTCAVREPRRLAQDRELGAEQDDTTGTRSGLTNTELGWTSAGPGQETGSGTVPQPSREPAVMGQGQYEAEKPIQWFQVRVGAVVVREHPR